jgi:hypothetical protein
MEHADPNTVPYALVYHMNMINYRYPTKTAYLDYLHGSQADV